MGSGKSTLARHMAQQLKWDCISEDAYWAENGWAGFRSSDQEQVVQRQVIDRLLSVCRSGRSVVLEFILYAEPPNPLSAYQRALDDNSVAYGVIVLKPSVAEVMRRIAVRGRAGDLQRLVEREQDVEHQMQVLESETLRSYRFVDSSDLSVEEATWACLESLGRLPS
jgi:adenylate kinase family enzyme